MQGKEFQFSQGAKHIRLTSGKRQLRLMLSRSLNCSNLHGHFSPIPLGYSKYRTQELQSRSGLEATSAMIAFCQGAMLERMPATVKLRSWLQESAYANITDTKIPVLPQGAETCRRLWKARMVGIFSTILTRPACQKTPFAERRGASKQCAYQYIPQYWSPAQPFQSDVWYIMGPQEYTQCLKPFFLE